MKGAFTRTCIACNNKDNKYNLLRISCTKNKEISIDKTGRNTGRGIYLCYNLECLKKILKTNKLEKRLKVNVSEKFYEDIRGVIIEREESKKNVDRKENGGEV